MLFLYSSSGNLDDQSYRAMHYYVDPPKSTDSTLSIMTYNLGYLSGMTNNRSIKREEAFFENNLVRSQEILGGFDLDVVGIQEIDFGANRSFEVNQMHELATVGQYAIAYQSVNWDKKYVPFPYWPPSNHFGKMLSGQAILSKLSMKEIETIILPPNETAPYYYRAFYLDRLLQIAEVNFLGTTTKIMNVHLEAYDKETRLKQIEIVKEEFEKYAANQPVILLGDFNSESPGIKELDAIDVLAESAWISSAIPFNKEKANGTFSSENPRRMIDYIFYNTNFLICDSARVVSEAGQISDHLPVIALMQLK